MSRLSAAAVSLGFVLVSALRKETSLAGNLTGPAEDQDVPYKWLNAEGEKLLDCGLGPEYRNVKLLLTSSMFDDNGDAMATFFRELPPPPGVALWIGDATAGARPYSSRFTYYGNSWKAWFEQTGYSLRRVLLNSQGWGPEDMEKLFDNVGVVYLEGGDHLYLMDAMRKSGFADALMPRFLKGSVAVIARSAGTIDSGLDVGFSLERESEALLNGNFTGLGLVGECSLRGHFQSAVWHNASRHHGVSETFDKEARAQFERTGRQGRLVTLEDGQALMVKNGTVRIVPDNF